MEFPVNQLNEENPVAQNGNPATNMVHFTGQNEYSRTQNHMKQNEVYAERNEVQMEQASNPTGQNGNVESSGENPVAQGENTSDQRESAKERHENTNNSPGISNTEMIAAYIPEYTGSTGVDPSTSLPQLRTTFESDQGESAKEQHEKTNNSPGIPKTEMIAAYIPEYTGNTGVDPSTSLPQLRTTFESAKFWLRCAENACQRVAKYDTSIGHTFHTTVQDGLNQFLNTMKDASQKCIDDATRYLPELSLNPASLMPPIDEPGLENEPETFDVKPDPRSLQRAILNGSNSKQSGHDLRNGGNVNYDETFDDIDYDDDSFDYLLSKNMRRKKSRKKKKLMEDDVYKCAECVMDFANNDEFMSHVELNHPDKSDRVCPHCSKVLSTPRACKKHISDVHNKRRICSICGHKYAYQYELDNHMKKHMGTVEPDTFACQICGYTANRMRHLKSHIKFKHPEYLDDGVQVSDYLEEVKPGGTFGDVKDENPSADKVGDFTCMVCNVNFKTKKLLHSHLKTHMTKQERFEEGGDQTNFKCTKCHKICGSEKALFTHIKRVHSKSLKCKFCRKTFFAKYQLEGHLRVHFNLKPFRCDTCAKAFPSLTALRIHTRLKHPDRYASTPFKCQRCDVAFTFKAQLDKHNNSQHSFTDPDLSTNTDAESSDLSALAANVKVEVMENATTQEKKEQCKKCGRAFSTDRLLWQHIRRVHNKKFSCSFCGKKFGYPGELKDHEMLHTNQDAFACDYCDKKSHTRALIVQHAKFVHPLEMAQMKFACDVCEEKFALSVSLDHHLRLHAPQSTEIFSCDICLRNFPTQLRLKTHKMVGHEDDNEMFAKEGNPLPPYLAKFQEFALPEPVMCNKCGLDFPTMDALSKHKTQEHKNDPKLQCPACDKICPSKEALRNHKRRVHTKKRECAVCNKKFPFKYVLDAHMLTHTGERNFCCQQCKKTFYTIQQLNVHVRLVHSARTFNCDLCSAKFGTKQGRDRHVQHKHTNERPQTCEYCGKGFVDRRSLKAHIFIHTRQSDIKCDDCGRLFGTRSCLNKHIRIKHKGERKLCPICGKHIAGSIGMHLKSHGEKRYKCHLCEKIYAWPQGLKEHLRTHSGEKPYECKICNKRFLGSANFSKHKKIHSNMLKGEGPRRRMPAAEKVEKVDKYEKYENYEKYERQQYVEPQDREPQDFRHQYQAVMNQSINQLMMNQSMINPSMVNQSMLNQSMLSQSMMMHGHNEMNPQNMHWQL